MRPLSADITNDKRSPYTRRHVIIFTRDLTSEYERNGGNDLGVTLTRAVLKDESWTLFRAERERERGKEGKTTTTTTTRTFSFFKSGNIKSFVGEFCFRCVYFGVPELRLKSNRILYTDVYVVICEKKLDILLLLLLLLS